MRLAWLYDFDACFNPTGVTRHALAQLDGLARRSEVELSVVSGRIADPDGLARWHSLAADRRYELPMRTRDMLRLWRLAGWPPVTFWTGPQDWVYCPAEYYVAVDRRARLAVTSHDVLQDVKYGSSRRRDLVGRVLQRADRVLSVSAFNTARLIEQWPDCRDKIRPVPNAADDLFFEAATEAERAAVRADLGLPDGLPYLISVANFQARKNLVRLVRAVGRLREVADGSMAVVLLGSGSDEQAGRLKATIETLGPSVQVVTPGYRQGKPLRAAYAEASALVFPSLCESFGIPAVEAMAQGCPVALADDTALPEIGGEAGWYFPPSDESAIEGALRSLLDDDAERARRVERGRKIASKYRWDRANEALMAALCDPG